MADTYRIMVVDDEEFVREAVAAQVPWEKYQIEVVKTAQNAIEALDYLREHEVNLMLTDIRLPVMDGLELVRRAREEKPEVDFIMISGYADFEYARQAMRCGALDYLLKPLNEVSLLSAVRKAQESWEQRRLARQLKGLGVDMEYQETAGRAAYSPTVSQLLAIVNEEIANEELTLKWISSERMYLNETYLSKLFQKEVGQKFTAYLVQQRMLLAMRLMLRLPDAMIQTIAARTGFGDNAQYFSIVFKKYTGLTPSEFRKKLGKG